MSRLRPLLFSLPLALGLSLGVAPLVGPVRAASDCARDAMLVFDGSASMEEIGFDVADATRIDEARDALRRAMPQIAPFRRIGLVTYGPGSGGSCGNINLAFPPRRDAGAAVVGSIEALRPSGMTPLAASVRRAAEILDYTRRPAIVVLVTDGNETCGGRPCRLGQHLRSFGRDLTVHVIGFRVVQDFFSWDSPEQTAYDGQTVAKCLSDQTGGMYVSTETVDELSEALQLTLGCPLIGAAPDRSKRRRG